MMTPARKRRHGFNSSWMTFLAVCTKCGHTWQAVMPNVGKYLGTLQCPHCMESAGAKDDSRALTPGELARAMDYATEVEAARKKVELARN